MKEKNENGITLIALVVTIVVLLILAGISLNLVIGNNGIIIKGKEAKVETKAATVLDERNMWMNDRYLSEKMNQTPKTMEEILSELEGKGILTSDDVNTIKNDANNEITIGSKTISFKVIEEEKEDAVDVLKPGDFIQYDAGKWTQAQIDGLKNAGYYTTAELPTASNPYTFGGFDVGNDRNTSINVDKTADITNNPEYKQGWKVLSNDNGTIKIITAGTVEAYQHTQTTSVAGFPSGGISEYILRNAVSTDKEHTLEDYVNTGIKPRDFTMYENELAVEKSAHCCSLHEMYDLTNSLGSTEDPLRKLGVFYHLASCQEKVGLARVEPKGTIYMSTNTSYGIRIVLTLKSGVKVVKDDQTDGTTYEKAWKIVM